MKVSVKPTVLLERFPYRYVQVGTLENGNPDYRIQRYNEDTKKYQTSYLLDNQQQLLLCMEDFEYVKWLHNEPSYVRDNVKGHYQ